MNKGLLLIVIVCALFAVSSARPLMFYASQSDAFFGLSFGWNGVALAFATYLKGQSNHRVRFFGVNHVNETLTGAWIMHQNQTRIATLQVNVRATDRYFIGDVRLNDTIFDLMLQEKIYVTVASSLHRNGSITGNLICKPHTGISFLDAGQVVTGSTSTSIGLGFASIDITALQTNTTSLDIITQDTQVATTSLFNGRVVHNSTGSTFVTVNGPANRTQTNTAIATASLSGFFNDGKFTNISINDNFLYIDNGLLYYLVDGTLGQIRGQIYPLVTYTRRAVPYKLITTAGTSRVSNVTRFSSLRFSNQLGNDKNPNSYVTCLTDPTDFNYAGLFYFPAGTNRKNFELVRGVSLEINAKVTGDTTGTWSIEFFDSTTGLFITTATLKSSNFANWFAAYVDYFYSSTSEFATNRKAFVIRVSTFGNKANSQLNLDLFGLRYWVPSSFTNGVWRQVVKLFQLLPAI
jgi:hypothetical protein